MRMLKQNVKALLVCIAIRFKAMLLVYEGGERGVQFLEYSLSAYRVTFMQSFESLGLIAAAFSVFIQTNRQFSVNQLGY